MAELGELAEVRRAARAAGRMLDWQVRTHAADNGVLLIFDGREPPEDVRRLVEQRAKAAIESALFDGS